MDPVTAGVGSLLFWVLEQSAGFVYGELTERHVHESLETLKHRVVGLGGLPENHDVARAIRIAELQALYHLLTDFAELPRPEWHRVLHLRPDVFIQTGLDYCRRAIASARNDVVSGALERNGS